MEIIFTEHARERIRKRKITEQEIMESIRYPDKIKKQRGKYYIQKNIQRARIEIVFEKDKYIKIITVYYL